MPRLPQPGAVLGPRGPGEIAAAALLGDLAEVLRLLGDLVFAAVEFQQQQRRLRQRQFRIGIAGPHLRGVEQFDARDGNAGLDRQDGGLAGAAHGLERTGRRRDGLGNAAQFDGQFGDDAERALGADEQMRQVVAGGGFLRARAGGDDLAVAAHHFQRQHVVAHGAVAHRIGAGGAGRRHAAERGVGAGIDREEQALVAQMLVERLAGDAGLDHAVEVLGMDREHPVHVAQIDADAAGGRIDLPLQRGAGAERDHGNAVFGADPHHVLDIGGLLRHHHRVRRLGRQPGGGMGVLFAHRLRGDQPVAEPRRKRFHACPPAPSAPAASDCWYRRCHENSSRLQKTVAKDI